ncbi:MAG: hypothetical protein H0V14_04875 [Chitinophagaceae bacterium]|nr:hypothetical protein [Chitinophagaceae bacterium]
MKKLFFAFALFLAMSFTTKSAQAQITSTDVVTAAGNLVNVQIGSININAVDVVDVSNVLNNNDVDVVLEILKNVKIDNVLNNLLRDAEIITGNQVVVGVVVDLLGNVTQILVVDKKSLK